MIVSVTTLGDNDRTPAAVGVAVVEYLEGGRALPGGRSAGTVVELPSPEGGTVAYYADSAGLRPGHWVAGRTGDVDRAELAALVGGYDPATGQPLLSTRGSAGRAERERIRPAPTLEKAWYSVGEFAAILSVSPSYAQRRCRLAISAAPARANSRDGALDDIASGDDAPGGVGAAIGTAGEEPGVVRGPRGRWQISRAFVDAALAERSAPRIVCGYDLTFSVEKSVSLLWATGDDETRAEILASIDEAVAAGLRYADRHALMVRVRGERVRAEGVLAADYLHTTSRALEPQLHHHVVLINYGRTPDGKARALDGMSLFLHAKTMGFVSGAELRHQLTARLGVEWTPVRNGTAELVGVPEQAIREMSTRRAEIDEATRALALSSAEARQVAAYDTRAPKARGVDADALEASWEHRLAAAGFGPAEHTAVLGRVDGPRLLTDAERAQLIESLVALDGLTASDAAFDRRHVVEALATALGDRCSGDAINELADEVLAHPDVVDLGGSRAGSTRDVIRRADGRVVTAPEHRYSTLPMLALEEELKAAYRSGRAAAAGVVPAKLAAEVLAGARFVRLSEDQRHFVRALVTSGQRIQAGVGPAGTGKTTALEAAIACWHAAGYEVIGAAVGGTQTVVLGEETGVEARTVASVLARVRHLGTDATLGPHTVLLVDEASLLSTSDAAALVGAIRSSGATLRLVGDPAQHGAVAAGGFFRWIVEHHAGPQHRDGEQAEEGGGTERRADECPALVVNRRQAAPELAEVRLALAEYREGKITEALTRLERDGRITEAGSVEDAYDLLACAWYAEVLRRREDPSRAASPMTAQRNFDRRELNARARALLKADGTLVGPELVVNGIGFQVNDEVIARIPDRELRAPGARHDAWVRNGACGRVAGVGADELVVEFERWGTVTVPRSYLERERNGVHGGLQHAYALTSYAAQGETHAVAMPFLTDESCRAAGYVQASRGTHDLKAVVVRVHDLPRSADGHELPVLRDEATALQATARSLEHRDEKRFASEVDPHAARVADLARTHTLPELMRLVDEGTRLAPLHEEALARRTALVAHRAVAQPSQDILTHLGPRPAHGDSRNRWDLAVGTIAIWQEREHVRPDPQASGVVWALGERPDEPDGSGAYDLIASYVTAASPPATEAATAPSASSAEPREAAARRAKLASGIDEGGGSEEESSTRRGELVQAIDHDEREVATSEGSRDQGQSLNGELPREEHDDRRDGDECEVDSSSENDAPRDDEEESADDHDDERPRSVAGYLRNKKQADLEAEPWRHFDGSAPGSRAPELGHPSPRGPEISI